MLGADNGGAEATVSQRICQAWEESNHSGTSCQITPASIIGLPVSLLCEISPASCAAGGLIGGKDSFMAPVINIAVWGGLAYLLFMRRK